MSDAGSHPALIWTVSVYIGPSTRVLGVGARVRGPECTCTGQCPPKQSGVPSHEMHTGTRENV